jgi:hypothetical protein
MMHNFTPILIKNDKHFLHDVKFEVFTVMKIEFMAFWVAALGSVVDGYQCFRRLCCIHLWS